MTRATRYPPGYGGSKPRSCAHVRLVILSSQVGDGEHRWMSAYLDAAIRAAKWLRAEALPTSGGVGWPEAPGMPPVATFYYGTAGVVVFLVELFKATQDEEWLDLAQAAAGHLAESIETSPRLDFPRGIAGMGFALAQIDDAAGQQRLEGPVQRVFERVQGEADWSEGGAHWGGVNDVSSGSAGIGLYLLWHGRRTQDAAAIDLAKGAGARLVAIAQPVDGGVRWDSGAWRPVVLPTDKDQAFYMPNFSHGTAGVAYFLATLAVETGDTASAKAAEAAARYLQSIAVIRPDGTWKILNHHPGGEDIYYMGFCHGPAGTSRLFYQLAKLDPSADWNEWFVNGARSLLRCTDPAERYAGLWTNIGICCGTAGVGRFAVEAYRATGVSELQTLAGALADDLIRDSTAMGDGLGWVNTEHRLRPEERRIQCGFMQGAAGIGSFLLAYDGVLSGKDTMIRTHDDPFAPGGRSAMLSPA